MCDCKVKSGEGSWGYDLCDYKMRIEMVVGCDMCYYKVRSGEESGGYHMRDCKVRS